MSDFVEEISKNYNYELTESVLMCNDEVFKDYVVSISHVLDNEEKELVDYFLDFIEAHHSELKQSKYFFQNDIGLNVIVYK